MQGTANLVSEIVFFFLYFLIKFFLKFNEPLEYDNNFDEMNESEYKIENDYVAILLYYVDGPVNTVKLQSNVQIIGEKECLFEKRLFF